MAELVVENLTVSAAGSILVDSAGFRVRPGELVALLGANGAGKTSLVRASLGLLKSDSGTARIAGARAADLSAAERARRAAYLPQARPLAWPNRVRDLVALGRFSHGAALGRLSEADAAAVSRAMDACDVAHLAERRADTLSGGELTRVHCARALASEAALLVADEPTAALDPRQQFRIMDVISGFVSGGGGALVVLHDVRLAARHATRLIWMKSGRIVADGPSGETLTPSRLVDVYGVRGRVESGRVELDGAV